MIKTIGKSAKINVKNIWKLLVPANAGILSKVSENFLGILLSPCFISSKLSFYW